MIDQRAAFIAEGMDEERATDEAIKEMGDPVLVGSELDRAHRPKIEWSIIALTGIILLIGFAVRIFVTYDTGQDLSLTTSIVSFILGIGCIMAAYYLDFSAIGKYPKRSSWFAHSYLLKAKKRFGETGIHFRLDHFHN